MNAFRSKHKALYRVCIDSGCNFLAVLFDMSYFPQGVQKTSLSLAGVTGTGDAQAQGVAHVYCRTLDDVWCELVLDGAAYQPDCPVHLLSLDALHYKCDVRTEHKVDFDMSRVTMGDGNVLELSRDNLLRLHFMNIMPYYEFVKLKVPESEVVRYYF